MAKTAYQVISEVIQRVDHLEATKLGGDPGTITLHSVAAGGGVNATPLLTLKDFWTHQQLGDGLGGFIDQFTIAETALRTINVKKVHSIKFNGTLYAVPARKSPAGRERVWRFRTRALQDA